MELIYLPLLGSTTFLCSSQMFLLALLVVRTIYARQADFGARAWASVAVLGAVLSVALEVVHEFAGSVLSTQAMVIMSFGGIFAMMMLKGKRRNKARLDDWSVWLNCLGAAVLGFLATHLALDYLAMRADEHSSAICTGDRWTRLFFYIAMQYRLLCRGFLPVVSVGVGNSYVLRGVVVDTFCSVLLSSAQFIRLCRKTWISPKGPRTMASSCYLCRCILSGAGHCYIALLQCLRKHWCVDYGMACNSAVPLASNCVLLYGTFSTASI
jgi:hypothetical protein